MMEISHLTRKAVHGIIPWLNLGAMDPCRELSVSKKYPSTVCVQPGIGCVFYSPSKGILNWLIYIYIYLSIYCVNNVSNVIQEFQQCHNPPHRTHQLPMTCTFQLPQITLTIHGYYRILMEYPTHHRSVHWPFCPWNHKLAWSPW